MADSPSIAVVGADVSLVVGLTMAMPDADVVGYETPEEVAGDRVDVIVLSAPTTGECLDMAERLNGAEVACIAIGDEPFDDHRLAEVFTRPLNRARLVERLAELVSDVAVPDAIQSGHTSGDGEDGRQRGVLGFLRRAQASGEDEQRDGVQVGAADREVVSPEAVSPEVDIPEVREGSRRLPQGRRREEQDVEEDSEAEDLEQTDDRVADDRRVAGIADVEAADAASEIAVGNVYAAEIAAIAANTSEPDLSDETQPPPESCPHVDSEHEPDHETQQRRGAEPPTEPDVEPETEPETESEVQPDVQPDVQAETERATEPEVEPGTDSAPNTSERHDDESVAAALALTDLNAPLPTDSPGALVEHLVTTLGADSAVVWEPDPEGHLAIVAAAGLSRLERRAWVPKDHVLAALIARGPGGAGHAVLDTTEEGVVRLSTHDPRLRHVVGIGPAVNLALVSHRSAPRLVVVAADEIEPARFATAAS